MIRRIDVTPHKIRVIANKYALNNICPVNLVGTILELNMNNQEYRLHVHNKPEEAIIHVIFTQHVPFMPIELKVRWDNNTTDYVQKGSILLVSTTIPMSSSIWGDRPDIAWAPGDYDIAKENRELNRKKRDNSRYSLFNTGYGTHQITIDIEATKDNYQSLFATITEPMMLSSKKLTKKSPPPQRKLNIDYAMIENRVIEELGPQPKERKVSSCADMLIKEDRNLWVNKVENTADTSSYWNDGMLLPPIGYGDSPF